MRFLATILFAMGLAAGGCSASPCERLADELCTTRGEDDAICQVRRAATEDRTRIGDLQCKRALFLYQAESGSVER